MDARVKHYDTQIQTVANTNDSVALLMRIEKKEDAVSQWAKNLKQRRHPNVAIVAMANKLARIAWAVMTTGKAFDAERGALAKPAAVTA
ncbi:hypothetical protein [Halochromatium roseum]|uniref:hypothetical protein n=1 Tax=Halochromatium roseum TaxID=391920 RepID=UPI003B8312D0